jgi:hypothetical protein
VGRPHTILLSTPHCLPCDGPCTLQMMATAPEESINPTRDVPLAIGISVGGCTILYLLMALVISGTHMLIGWARRALHIEGRSTATEPKIHRINIQDKSREARRACQPGPGFLLHSSLSHLLSFLDPTAVHTCSQIKTLECKNGR